MLEYKQAKLNYKEVNMTKIKGKVKAVSGPNEFQGVLQIGFTLEADPKRWYNISGKEGLLKEILDTMIKKGNEIEFDEDTNKNIAGLTVIKAAEEKKGNGGTGEFHEDEIVDIKGKKHVIYEGLLRLAHQKGLKKFEIIDKFVSDDMKIAWVQVRAYCEKAKQEVFFDGIGSSTPDNTGTMTEHHPVEMAHTRAKGRALRDFLNIGQAMAEEIKQEK